MFVFSMHFVGVAGTELNIFIPYQEHQELKEAAGLAVNPSGTIIPTHSSLPSTSMPNKIKLKS